MNMIYKVNEIAYHRNGVNGNGFYAAKFTQRNGRQFQHMIAIVFEEKGNCAVFDQSLLGLGNIKFSENSWRGDEYEPELREAIESWEEKRIQQ